jgi:hypothetical protein
MTKLSHGQKHYDRKQIAEEFVREWVSSNVSPLPGLVDVARQVDTLACQMTADARLQGIIGANCERRLNSHLPGPFALTSAARNAPAKWNGRSGPCRTPAAL